MTYTVHGNPPCSQFRYAKAGANAIQQVGLRTPVSMSHANWRTKFNLLNGVIGGAMVLGNLPVSRRATNLVNRGAMAYCACSRCGWGCLDIFSLVYPFFFFLPLSGRRPSID